MNHDSFHWGVRHSNDDDGETLHLRNLGSQRSYGTCSYGDGSAFGSMYSHRSSPIGRISRECLTHTVSSSETLAGIALKYDLTIEDIRRYNSLWQNDNVWPGQKLKIPVTAAASPTGGSEPQNSSSLATSASASELKLSASTKEEMKKTSTSLGKGSNSHSLVC